MKFLKKVFKIIGFSILGVIAIFAVVGIAVESNKDTEKDPEKVEKIKHKKTEASNEALQKQKETEMRIKFSNLEPDGIKHVLAKHIPSSANWDIVVEDATVPSDKIGYLGKDIYNFAEPGQKSILITSPAPEAFLSSESFLYEKRKYAAKVFEILFQNKKTYFVKMQHNLKFTTIRGNEKENKAYVVESRSKSYLNDSLSEDEVMNEARKINWNNFELENMPRIFKEWTHPALK